LKGLKLPKKQLTTLDHENKLIVFWWHDIWTFNIWKCL